MAQRHGEAWLVAWHGEVLTSQRGGGDTVDAEALRGEVRRGELGMHREEESGGGG